MTIEEKTQDAVTRAAATPLVYLVYLGKLNAVATQCFEREIEN